jgi:hypothetical protein
MARTRASWAKRSRACHSKWQVAAQAGQAQLDRRRGCAHGPAAEHVQGRLQAELPEPRVVQVSLEIAGTLERVAGQGGDHGERGALALVLTRSLLEGGGLGHEQGQRVEQRGAELGHKARLLLGDRIVIHRLSLRPAGGSCGRPCVSCTSRRMPTSSRMLILLAL